MRALRRGDVIDDTLLVFTSDNGYLLGQHRLHAKNAFYDGAARVPLLLRAPGIDPATVIGSPVVNTDLAATIYDFTGVDPALPQDGVSLFDVVADPGQFADRAFPMQTTRGTAIRTPEWLYAEYEAEAGPEFELYGLAADPHQLTSRTTRPATRTPATSWPSAWPTCASAPGVNAVECSSIPAPRTRGLVAFALAACLASALIIAGGGETAAGQADKRPNIVVVMTDDQDYRSLRVMPQVRSLLGRHGVKFTRSYATFPLCCPSRVTYLTGQYSHNHGVRNNKLPDGGFPVYNEAPAASANAAVALQANGYKTAWIGKFLNGYPNYGRQFPKDIPDGFDHWMAGLGLRMFDWALNANGRIIRFGRKDSDYNTDVYARKGKQFIERSAPKERPFFPHPRAGGPARGAEPRQSRTRVRRRGTRARSSASRSRSRPRSTSAMSTTSPSSCAERTGSTRTTGFGSATATAPGSRASSPSTTWSGRSSGPCARQGSSATRTSSSRPTTAISRASTG